MNHFYIKYSVREGGDLKPGFGIWKVAADLSWEKFITNHRGASPNPTHHIINIEDSIVFKNIGDDTHDVDILTEAEYFLELI